MKFMLGVLLLGILAIANSQDPEPTTTTTAPTTTSSAPTTTSPAPTTTTVSISTSEAPATTTTTVAPVTTTSSSVTTTTVTPGAVTTTTVAPTTASVITTTSSTTPTPTNTRCQKPGLTCLDCRSLQYCDFGTGEEPVFNITCTAQTGKPYCDQTTDECVKDSTCSASNNPEALVECQQPGLRPDPNDCTQYVQCIKDSSGTSPSGYIGYTVNCPDGLRYSQTLEKCVSTLSCPVMKTYCSGKPGKLVPYKPFPSIYGLCPTDKKEDVSVIRMCKGQYQFVESVGNCQPVCKKIGKIASNEDCHKYYSCDSNGLGYSMILNSCPTGFGYNATTQLCDAGEDSCTSLGRVSRRRRDLGIFDHIWLTGY